MCIKFRLLRLPEVLRITGLSKSRLYDLKSARPFPTLRGHRPPRRRVEGLRCVGMGRIPALDTRDRPPLTPTDPDQGRRRTRTSPERAPLGPVGTAGGPVRPTAPQVCPGRRPEPTAAARTIPARSPEVPGGRRRSVKAPLHERGFQLDFMEQAWPGRPGCGRSAGRQGAPLTGRGRVDVVESLTAAEMTTGVDRTRWAGQRGGHHARSPGHAGRALRSRRSSTGTHIVFPLSERLETYAGTTLRSMVVSLLSTSKKWIHV